MGAAMCLRVCVCVSEILLEVPGLYNNNFFIIARIHIFPLFFYS